MHQKSSKQKHDKHRSSKMSESFLQCLRILRTRFIEMDNDNNNKLNVLQWINHINKKDKLFIIEQLSIVHIGNIKLDQQFTSNYNNNNNQNDNNDYNNDNNNNDTDIIMNNRNTNTNNNNKFNNKMWQQHEENIIFEDKQNLCVWNEHIFDTSTNKSHNQYLHVSNYSGSRSDECNLNLQVMNDLDLPLSIQNAIS